LPEYFQPDYYGISLFRHWEVLPSRPSKILVREFGPTPFGIQEIIVDQSIQSRRTRTDMIHKDSARPKLNIKHPSPLPSNITPHRLGSRRNLTPTQINNAGILYQVIPAFTHPYAKDLQRKMP
jgi:hypothetical protein